MQFPSWVVECVEQANRDNKDNINDAVEEALECLTSDPRFKEVTDALVRNAVRDLVYDARHIINVKIKRETGRYATTQKVDPSKTTSVQKIYSSCYDYNIAGRTLGNILGQELGGIARTERATASGHMKNAYLIESLMPMVGPDKMVRECISEKRLRNLFNKAEAKTKVAAS